MKIQANGSTSKETAPARGTATANPQEMTSTKRKTRRKSGSTAASAAPLAEKEILFKDLPNPFETPQPPFIWIDYPQANERLLAPVYAIRLGVGGAEWVEMAIDNGPWQTCRLTSGYWWFDWANIAPGKHTLVARMRTPDGKWYRTPPRPCTYRP